MSRRADERTILRPLVADLARRYQDGEAGWQELMDRKVLRKFRRQLDETGELLAEQDCTPQQLDRARSICAELLVAAQLLDSGCFVEHEVETPTGKHVDFRALKDNVALHVHVKRAPQTTLRDAQASVPPAWRALEDVPRGLVVALSLSRNLRGRPMHAALTESFAFLEQASVGEEISFRDAEARTAARLRVIAPSTGTRVEVVADLSAGFDEHVPRFQATLRKAFGQFMPRGENVIVVCGSAGGVEAFATALLGSHIQRWDKRPRVGELVAYGRGGDGFWAGSMRNQSRLAAYWTLARGSGPLLFLREAVNTRAESRQIALARSIFA